jgi:hypothetical protein
VFLSLFDHIPIKAGIEFAFISLQSDHQMVAGEHVAGSVCSPGDLVVSKRAASFLKGGNVVKCQTAR